MLLPVSLLFEKRKEYDEAMNEILSARVDFTNGGIMACVIRWLDEDCRTDKKILASLISSQIKSLYAFQ